MYGDDIKRPVPGEIKPRDDGIRRPAPGEIKRREDDIQRPQRRMRVVEADMEAARRSSSSNTDKEQLNLAMGSEEYKDHMLEKAGVDEKSLAEAQGVFQGGVPVGHVRIDEGSRVESDEFQQAAGQPAGEYAVNLSRDMRDAAQAVRDRDVAVNRQRYTARMQKLDKYPNIIKGMEQQVAATATRADDKAVAKLKGRDCDDMPEIVDTSLTAEDLTMRSFQKYM